MKPSPAMLVARLLESEGFFETPVTQQPWSLFVSSMPDGDIIPDDCGVVFDTDPLKDGRIMKTGEVIFHHGIQLRVRSQDYQEGWDKCESVSRFFSGVSNKDVEYKDMSYLFKNISSFSGVLALGLEEGTKRRYLFTVNFLITMEVKK